MASITPISGAVSSTLEIFEGVGFFGAIHSLRSFCAPIAAHFAHRRPHASLLMHMGLRGMLAALLGHMGLVQSIRYAHFAHRQPHFLRTDGRIYRGKIVARCVGSIRLAEGADIPRAKRAAQRALCGVRVELKADVARQLFRQHRLDIVKVAERDGNQFLSASLIEEFLLFHVRDVFRRVHPPILDIEIEFGNLSPASGAPVEFRRLIFSICLLCCGYGVCSRLSDIFLLCGIACYIP